MARTVLNPTPIKGPYPGPVAADGLDFAFTAGDDVNGHEFAASGREILLARNVDGAAAHGFSLISTPDPQNRSADITDYQLGPNEFAVFQFGPITGWAQPDGTIQIDVDDAQIELALLRR